MSTWSRALVAHLCGRCGHVIAVGEPMLTITLSGVRRTLHRCGSCAGGEIPDLAPVDGPPQPRTKRMEPARAIASRVVSDVKARQWKESA